MRKIASALVIASIAACSLQEGGVIVAVGIDSSVADAYVSPYDAAFNNDAGTIADGSGPKEAAADTGASCPTNLPGPPMVLVGNTCVDSTEVSNKQYDQYRKSYDAGSGSGDCSWIGPVPSGTTGTDDKPVVYVHWCDASLFCKWAGKHLCGARGGGGSIGTSDVTNAAVSEWFNACSSNSKNAYPYGAQYVKTNCNTEFQKGGTVSVGSIPTCVGPKGVYDLSGNVREWIDSCEGSGQYASCQFMNGDFYTGQPEAQCTHSDKANRNATYQATVGFRCCY